MPWSSLLTGDIAAIQGTSYVHDSHTLQWDVSDLPGLLSCVHSWMRSAFGRVSLQHRTRDSCLLCVT